MGKQQAKSCLNIAIKIYDYKTMKKTNQPKETKMLEMKTTYQSKNWDKRLSQWCKENREKKQIKINLIKEMKKDNDLKKYVNDIEKLNFEQFTVLINIFKKVNLNK
jgi:hypothetical protein